MNKNLDMPAIAPATEGKTVTANSPTIKKVNSVGSDPDQFKEAIQPPPISERLDRLDFLNSLCSQRDEVLEAIEKLNRFEQSPQGGQSIIFRGATGESTSTHHPFVIEEMVTVATRRLKAKLQEIEMMILI